MEDKSTSVEIPQLIAEFKEITESYERALNNLPRRHEIVYTLIQLGMTHKQAGQLLGLSAARVGQLVQGAPGYVPARLPGE